MIIYKEPNEEDLTYTNKTTEYSSFNDYLSNNITCAVVTWMLQERCGTEYYTPTPYYTSYLCPTASWSESDNYGTGTHTYKYAWMSGVNKCCVGCSSGGDTNFNLKNIMMGFNNIYNPGDSDFCLKIDFNQENSYYFYEKCSRCSINGWLAAETKLYGNCSNFRIACSCCYSYCDGTYIHTCTVTCNYPFTLYFIKQGVNCYICNDNTLISDNGVVYTEGSYTTANVCWCRQVCVSSNLYPTKIQVLSGNIKHIK